MAGVDEEEEALEGVAGIRMTRTMKTALVVLVGVTEDREEVALVGEVTMGNPLRDLVVEEDKASEDRKITKRAQKHLVVEAGEEEGVGIVRDPMTGERMQEVSVFFLE